MTKHVERRGFLVVACVLMSGLGSCHSSGLEPRTARELEVRRSVLTLPHKSVEGREISVVSIGAGKTVLLLASIHGDEAGGTPLLEELVRRIRCGEIELPDRKLVVVPVLNPDGFAKHRRLNAHGVDLNRNFPADNFQASSRFGPRPLSEPESALVADLVRDLRPSHVVSFHQPARCIDYDGPARELAQSLGAVSPLPVKRLGGRPGSLGSWVGETMGIPTITVELPGGVERLGRDELWERHGPLLERAINW